MTANEILIDLRLTHSVNGHAKAYADVTILLGPDGMEKLHGFAVLHPDKESPRVAPPARKGKDRYFDTVTLTGRIRQLVESEILKEYQRQINESQS